MSFGEGGPAHLKGFDATPRLYISPCKGGAVGERGGGGAQKVCART